MKKIILAAAVLGLIPVTPAAADATIALAGKLDSERHLEATRIHPQLEEELDCFDEYDDVPRGREINAKVGKLREWEAWWLAQNCPWSVDDAAM